MSSPKRVKVWKEAVTLPTYEPMPPDRNPMFLDRRVYQGSSGKVYPLPFVDRISTTRIERTWQAVYLENKFLKVMLLPEIGGRIHAILDKTNGYDVIYRQEVIKPALVGLAGPWISGGIEFNWPQHHRPSTFMPTDVSIEEHADGSATVWMGEHDPMTRMKGMHGVCLHPDKSLVEVKVRLYNRTPLVQTFLWWANVGVRVHESYQSFFPPDVGFVSDHAKRAMCRFPLCEETYYGVDYGRRGRRGVPNDEQPRKFPPQAAQYSPGDLSWYANIPVPTSYMAVGSKEDFFGGYDHARGAGLVHVANHHISPGKKQWTWGNHDFGYAWDRHLSDDEAPYVELMAGVYTDNQPDFSFLMPGETKTFSQHWYPIRDIGPVDCANVEAAASLTVRERKARVGVAVSSPLKSARVTIAAAGNVIWDRSLTITPAKPAVAELTLPAGIKKSDLKLVVEARGGRRVLGYQPMEPRDTAMPSAARHPPEPAKVATADELYLIGMHLEQNRHATRTPESYWLEALRRDPLDSRCNNALGRWHLHRGEFRLAVECFRLAIFRLTRRNPNPYDGEPYYNLGLALRYLNEDEQAYDAFYKSTWNAAWQSAGFLALAELDCRGGKWAIALDHLDRSLRVDSDQLRARDLKAIVLRKLRRNREAQRLLRETLEIDRLDSFARWLLTGELTCDTQVILDLALDLSRAGLHADALDLLRKVQPEGSSGTEPLVNYYSGYLSQKLGAACQAEQYFAAAARDSSDHCFPARIEEIAILHSAIAANPVDPRASYHLGNLLYDRRQYTAAIALWEQSARLAPSFSIVWRNLGIAYFNVTGDAARARAAYDRAIEADRSDARVLFERDQLWKRTGVAPKKRLAELARHPALVAARDDLSVELCALYNLAGRHEQALALISSRHFHPWEGGEGQALEQYVRTHLALGQRALKRQNAVAARRHFAQALQTPQNLGEARHLLSNRSDVEYFLGIACVRLGDHEAAREHLTRAAESHGDFQGMSIRPYSEMTYYSAMALRRLGKETRAVRLLERLMQYSTRLRKRRAEADYFATSLPAMPLLNDDLQLRRDVTAMFLEAQAWLGLDQPGKARTLAESVLQLDPSHALALELVSATTVQTIAAVTARARDGHKRAKVTVTLHRSNNDEKTISVDETVNCSPAIPAIESKNGEEGELSKSLAST